MIELKLILSTHTLNFLATKQRGDKDFILKMGYVRIWNNLTWWTWQALCDKRDNNFVWNISPIFTFF